MAFVVNEVLPSHELHHLNSRVKVIYIRRGQSGMNKSLYMSLRQLREDYNIPQSNNKRIDRFEWSLNSKDKNPWIG
jgi:hypothetical protein